VGRICTHHIETKTHNKREKEGDDEGEFSSPSGSHDGCGGVGLLTPYRTAKMARELIAQCPQC
jgi:hypothetical protein